MSVNLLSLGQLDDNGLRFEFNNKIAKAFNKQSRKLIFTAKRINSRLYEIATCHTQQQALLASSKVRASIDLEGWHRRLGHIGKDTIRQIHSINSINGLDIDPSNTLNKICEPCQLGKKKQIIPKSSGTRSDKILCLIHSDLSGKFSKRSLSGKYYYITFIDDYTRYTWIRFIITKDEALQTFKD
jgi:hypothetical protein